MQIPPLLRRASASVLIAFVSFGLTAPTTSAADALPPQVTQLVVTTSASWSANRGLMQCFERKSARHPWQPVLKKHVPVMLGKKGSAWGVGTLTTNDPNAIRKREGDKKAPAGVFAIGRVFGYAAKPPAGTTIPYRKVTKWDAWIDDVNNPLYNQHVVVDPNRVPAWFSKQKMRHGDFAYKWLLEIRHNSDPPKAGFGSAIFFHIRRGADRTTAGCTTMKESDLTRLISWLRPSAAPHYVLLPRAEYKARQATWRLP